MMGRLKSYKPRLQYHAMMWKFHDIGWVKWSTDRESRQTPRESAYAFCISDNQVNLIYAKAKVKESLQI